MGPSYVHRLLWGLTLVQRRRKDFLIGGGVGGGGAQSETTHRVVSNLYNNFMKHGGGTCPRCPPGSYAYVVHKMVPIYRVSYILLWVHLMYTNYCEVYSCT